MIWEEKASWGSSTRTDGAAASIITYIRQLNFPIAENPGALTVNLSPHLSVCTHHIFSLSLHHLDIALATILYRVAICWQIWADFQNEQKTFSKISCWKLSERWGQRKDSSFLLSLPSGLKIVKYPFRIVKAYISLMHGTCRHSETNTTIKHIYSVFSFSNWLSLPKKIQSFQYCKHFSSICLALQFHILKRSSKL